MVGMRRREFITLLGGATMAMPLPAHAQQPAMPVIGFLGSASFNDRQHLLAAFRQSLKDAGYVEGGNIAFEYRWAAGSPNQLRPLAGELANRQVAMIVGSGSPAAALAAKAATHTIPILFATGGDPIMLGLVASLNRPGGNATGVSLFNVELVAKQMEWLTELVPKAVILVLTNPNNPNSDTEITLAQAAARALRVQVDVLRASTEHDLDATFASLDQRRASAMLVSFDSFFFSRRQQIVALAAQHRMPSIYHWREFVAADGLMSYGTSLSEAYRQMGSYAARILKGEKPADLPVVQPTKFELVINLKTAKTLGLEIPPKLFVAADEVIE